jgi:hypothetical protein
MPTVISSLSNKLITFLILYVLAVIIFYYFAETMKDLLNTLFSGELLNFTGKSNNDDGFKYFAKLLMLVIAFYIGKSIGKDKKEGFFNDHYFASVSSLGRLASNGVPGIPMIGLWIIVNILRFIMLMMITCTVLPILWAFAIIFFCFLIIPIDSGFNIAEIMSKFDDIINDCLTDFKQDKRSDCDENMSIVQTIIFILKVIFHFIFKNLLPISYISIFVIAICDYIYNINNIGLKNMLIGATTGIIFVAVFILSNSGFESIRENLMQANLKSNFFKVNETDLFKKYEFDISKIPSGDKALEKINKDIAELNQTRTKDIKEIVKPIFSNNKD